jgi:mannosyltransferase
VSTPRGHVAGLAALTLVAGVLRFVGLDGGLWVDEISSLLESFRPPLLHVLTTYPGDTHHPLYSLLANLALKSLGEANWVIRLPAAVFGAATVPLLYLFGRRVTTGREAFLAAALLAVSYHHVWFSQNARGYSMLLFFAVLASHFLLLGLLPGHGAWLGGYAVAAALGTYTHLTMLFVVAAHAMLVAVLVVSRWRRREVSGRSLGVALLAFGAAAIVTLLLYAPILTNLLRDFLAPSTFKGATNIVWALAESVRVLGNGFGNVAGVAAVGVAVAIGLLSYLRRDRVALWLMVGPGLVTLVGAFAARGYVVPRYFFPLAGFALLLAVRGVMVGTSVVLGAVPRFAGRVALAQAAGTALLVVAIGASASPTVRSLGRPKQDFVGVARWIERNVPPEERVVTFGVARVAYVEWMRKPWTPLGRDDQAVLAELRRKGGRTWVVYGFPHLLEQNNPEAMRTIREECGPAQRFAGTLGGGDVFVCPLPPLTGDP